MDKAIQSFLNSERNLTICTAVDNVPYCANCFYAFVEEINILVFKSGSDTKHISNALINDQIAGTILPDIQKTGTIRGIQFTGKFITPEGELLDKAKKKYYLKYPFAVVMQGDFWAIEILSIKMTDNTLGFGKKLVWEKSSQEEINV